MKNKKNNIVSLQAGLAVLLSVAGGSAALAQNVASTSEQPPSVTLPAAPGAAQGSASAPVIPNITAGGVPATATTTTTTTTSSTAPVVPATSASTAPATAVPVVPAVSPATPTTTTTTTTSSTAAPKASPVPATGAAETKTPPAAVAAMPSPAPAPSASAVAAATAGAPSAAEMAIVQNSGILNTMTPAPPAGSGSMKSGMKVTDILAQPAKIRPLPEKYLVVKKDRNENDGDSRLSAARTALWQGHYQAALEIFDDLYKKRPHDMRIVMGRAVALQKLGQDDEAIKAYQGALASDPKNVEALTNMLGLIKAQDSSSAIAKLQRLRDMYPANADVTAQLGMVYGVSGDYKQAIKYLDMADALKPGNAVVLYNKAVAYDRMGRELEAADMYRKLLLISSDGDLDSSLPLEAVRNRLASMH